jgi:hypothetical protein
MTFFFLSECSLDLFWMWYEITKWFNKEVLEYELCFKNITTASECKRINCTWKTTLEWGTLVRRILYWLKKEVKWGGGYGDGTVFKIH